MFCDITPCCLPANNPASKYFSAELINLMVSEAQAVGSCLKGMIVGPDALNDIREYSDAEELHEVNGPYLKLGSILGVDITCWDLLGNTGSVIGITDKADKSEFIVGQYYK